MKMYLLLVLVSTILPLVAITVVKPSEYKQEEFDKCGLPKDTKPKAMMSSDNVPLLVDSLKKIMGGHRVATGAMPWVAKIEFDVPGTEDSMADCSGVLISKMHVLTAAHCFQYYNTKTNKTKNRSIDLGKIKVTVHIGATDLRLGSRVEGRGIEKIAFKKMMDEKFYKGKCQNHDMAIIQLDSAVPIDKYPPICLLDRDQEAMKMGSLRQINSPVYFSGFGCTPEINGDVLYQANMRPLNLCPFGGKHLACSKASETKAACGGDSGGPLAFIQDGRYYLYGILIAGEDCDNITNTADSLDVYERLEPKMAEVRRFLNMKI